MSPSADTTSPLPRSLEISMPQCAHSTRSSGKGWGDGIRAAHAIVVAVASSATAIERRILMIVPPHVAFEHSLVPTELEGPGGVGLDAAVAQEHNSRRQVTDVGRHMRREQERAAIARELARAPEQQPRRLWIQARRRLV